MTPPRARGRALPWVALVAVYVLWGSTYLGIKVAIETLPPFTMAGVRFLLAGTLLYPLARRRPAAARPTRRQWAAAAGVGVLLLVGGNGLVTFAEQTIPSGIAALLVATVPLWMVALDRLTGGGRLRWQVVAGLVLGSAGVLLLVRPWEGVGGEIDAVGAGIVLIGSLSWAIGSLRARTAPLPPEPLQGTAMQMLVAGVVLLLLGAATGEPADVRVGEVSAASLAALAWLVGAGSIVAFSAYGYALRTLPTATVATYAYVNPIVAVALGWAILGERLSGQTLLAGAVIAVAVVLIVTFRTRPAAPKTGGQAPVPQKRALASARRR
ncbi:EamA family transporter [Egicoccus sp. AB-alg2]|uniref:EamA family transporter n=1 Tax=Egicoccus sp. AB-alg2 TaxID=3242693 RepID=UPI00359DB69B